MPSFLSVTAASYRGHRRLEATVIATREGPVRVLGPSAWNTMVRLGQLPEPRTQMLVADECWDTVGGTSAGKAVHLHDLGVPVVLMTPLADDDAAAHIRGSLPDVAVEALPTAATEHHINLMSAAGKRVSVYTVAPATTPVPPVAGLADARAVVLDLAPWTRELALILRRGDLPVWTDLHDVPPESDWHEPFWRAATVVQCSDDNLPDPFPFLHRLVDDGVSLAICTRGAAGAVAVDAGHQEHRQDAEECAVVDTNGAGDAFFSGVMAAVLAGEATPDALAAGARQATRALVTRHIGPGIRDGRTGGVPTT